MPVLHFIIQIRQCRRCIFTGHVFLNKTGSTLVWVCWELLSLPSRGGSLVRIGSLARLLICSTYDHESEIEWKEELIKLLRNSENALCVTQIPMWELKSSLRYYRWPWLEFTTYSTAETQLNASYLHFSAWRILLYNAIRHPDAPQLHTDLREVYLFSASRHRNPNERETGQDLSADIQFLAGTKQPGVELLWDGQCEAAFAQLANTP